MREYSIILVASRICADTAAQQQLLQCAFCTFVILGVSHGLGAHLEHVPEDQRPKALIFKWAGQIAYIVVSTMVKFVVGIFLLRLCVNNGWQRITIWILLVLVGLFNIFYVFVAVFQCRPVPFYWWRYAEDAPITGTCNGRAMATIPTYIAVLLGIAGDLILALLPITLIKHAKLDKKTKISVICVLSLGSLYVTLPPSIIYPTNSPVAVVLLTLARLDAVVCYHRRPTNLDKSTELRWLLLHVSHTPSNFCLILTTCTTSATWPSGVSWNAASP